MNLNLMGSIYMPNEQQLIRSCAVCGSEKRKLVFKPLDIVICKSCGFCYRQYGLPETEYEELDRYLDATQDPNLMEARTREINNRTSLLKELLRSESHILDIGANDGALIQALGEKGFITEGIEPNSMMVKKAREKGLTIYCGTLEDCPEIEDKHYDVITLFHVLEHLNGPQKALDSIHQSLKPGGVLILELPALDSPMFKARRWRANWAAEEHLNYFTRKSLSRMLAQSGFYVEKMLRRNWDEEGDLLRDIILRLPGFTGLYSIWRRFREPFQPFMVRRLNAEYGPLPKRKLQTGVLGKAALYLLNRFNRGDGLFVVARSLERLPPRNSRSFSIRLREWIENIPALMIAALFAPFQTPSDSNADKILIVPTAKLGDMVAQLPVYNSLRQKFPNARLTALLLNPALAILIEDYVDNIIFVPDGLSFGSWFSLRKQLSQERFSRIYILAWSTRLDMLAYFSRIPERYGVFSQDTPFITQMTRKFLISHLTQYETGEFSSSVYQRLVGGSPEDIKRVIPLQDEWLVRAQEIMKKIGIVPDKKNVGILVGCGNKLKLWEPLKWATVCDFFSSRGFQVCLIGSDLEKGFAEEVLSSAKGEVVDTTGAFRLNELIGALQQMDLVVGVDSGPLYVAHSLGIRVVDIVGPIDPAEQMDPTNSYIVTNVGCSPCGFVMATERECRFGRRRCLEDLDPEYVIKVLEKALEGFM